MKGNLRIGRLVARKSADLKIEGVMLKLLRQLTELTLKHSGVVIIPIGRELSPADAGNGRRLGTRRVSSIDTAFVDDLFGKLLFNEIKRERVERRTTVNHAMKTARTAWNTVSRANPRVFPPKNPFDLHDDDEAKQDAQMKRIKRRAKLAKQAIVK
jgi:hypothetical protein